MDAPLVRLATRTAQAGLLLYAVCAPHTIAGAWVGLSLVILGWLARTLLTRRTGLRRTSLDLPLWLLFAWSVASALFSAEPRVSLLKLISVSTFLIYYCVQAMLTRRLAVVLASVMIVSGMAGALDRKSTRLNSSHRCISYAVFCLKKKK